MRLGRPERLEKKSEGPWRKRLKRLKMPERLKKRLEQPLRRPGRREERPYMHECPRFGRPSSDGWKVCQLLRHSVVRSTFVKKMQN